MSTIAVIIPTHNRPDLLHEAIDSVIRQTRKADEIIVVDDGSESPVSEQDLKSRYGNHLRVLRNDQAHGLAWARNQGVEAAGTDYIAHLDDDDKFNPEVLEHALKLLESSHQPGLVFLGATGFGHRADYFNRVGTASVNKILNKLQIKHLDGETVLFNDQLFTALLMAVPLTFQHAITSKEMWIKVSQLRRKAYALEHHIGSEQEAKKYIIGTLRDSEWALYAASICQHSVLINKPMYQVRCEGQGYSSSPNNAEKHLQQKLLFIRILHQASQVLPELLRWRAAIKENLEHEYFAASYHYNKQKSRRSAWKYLKKAIQVNFRPKYIKFAIRILLPTKA